jgi:hypothetical protein
MTGGGNNGISAIQIIDAGASTTAVALTGITLAGNTATITFTGPPGVATWQVKASADLQSFPITEPPLSPITEGPAGSYSVDVDITGDPNPYFLRIEN